MAVRMITLNLPAPLYERLAQRAKEAHRSVEDELLELVATAVPPGSALPEVILPATESVEDDPLEAFIGAFPSDIADWGDAHDKYLGAVILEHSADVNADDGQPNG